MCFPKIFENPSKFVEEIYDFESEFIKEWKDWGVGEDKYGKTKELNRGDFILKDSKDIESKYFLDMINDSFLYSTKKYLRRHNFKKNVIDSSIDCLNFSTFGLNEYKEKNVGMGPHIDQDKKNEDADYVIILYLTDDYDGGELTFIKKGVTIKPSAGDIVVFPGDKRFLHKINKISKGKKILINHHISLNLEKEK